MRYYLGLLLFILPILSQAQERKILTAKTQQAYNAYAELANDYIHALWGYRVELGKLNFKMLEYMNINPLQRKSILKYKHYNFLETLTFNKDPEYAYTRVFDTGANLPSSHRNSLNNSTEQMKESMDSIIKISIEIEEHISKRAYKSEEKLTGLYKLLDRCETHFEGFRSANVQIIMVLENAGNHYRASSTNEYIRHALQLKSLADPARRILYALRQNNVIKVAAAMSNLDVAMELIRETEHESLTGTPYQGKHYDKGVYVRYDFVLKLASDIRAYAREYMTADMSDMRYELQSPNYYYYNRRVLDKFNRVGRGLILQYNHFVDSSQVQLIKMVEEPHWFRVRHIDDKTVRPGREGSLADSKFLDSLNVAVNVLEGYAPNNLIFLLDVSQSMNTPEKLQLLKSSFKHLVDVMRPEDKVGIVTFSGEVRVVLEPTSSTEKEIIYRALTKLKPSGQSDVENGLRRAYKTLEDNYLKNGNNKIILATDGAFETLKRTLIMIKRNKNEGKDLSVFYYSKEEDNSVGYRLKQFAEAGGGRYAYIQMENANDIIIEEAQKANEGK